MLWVAHSSLFWLEWATTPAPTLFVIRSTASLRSDPTGREFHTQRYCSDIFLGRLTRDRKLLPPRQLGGWCCGLHPKKVLAMRGDRSRSYRCDLPSIWRLYGKIDINGVVRRVVDNQRNGQHSVHVNGNLCGYDIRQTIEAMGLPKLVVIAPWIANLNRWLRTLGSNKPWRTLKRNGAGHHTGEHIIGHGRRHQRFPKNQTHGPGSNSCDRIRRGFQGVVCYIGHNFLAPLR